MRVLLIASLFISVTITISVIHVSLATFPGLRCRNGPAAHAVAERGGCPSE